jgi:hypothetical protein
VEQKVYADLGTPENDDHNSWVLDTGTTNHMAGCLEHFIELDRQVVGTMKFHDDFVTNIEGCGSIVLSYKNGEHHTLTGVYYITRLKASIVSLGQLDKMGCRIDINRRTLRIFDQHGVLLGKVACDESRLYYLRLKVGHPVCLAVRSFDAA